MGRINFLKRTCSRKYIRKGTWCCCSRRRHTNQEYAVKMKREFGHGEEVWSFVEGRCRFYGIPLPTEGEFSVRQGGLGGNKNEEIQRTFGERKQGQKKYAAKWRGG